MMLLLSILVFFYLVQVRCWDLKTYGISNTYFASSVAVFKNRAFLALSRSVCHNNLTNPTLIEVPWTGENAHRNRGISQRTVRFPSSVEQNWGKCDQVCTLKEVSDLVHDRRAGMAFGNYRRSEAVRTNGGYS